MRHIYKVKNIINNLNVKHGMTCINVLLQLAEQRRQIRLKPWIGVSQQQTVYELMNIVFRRMKM